MQQKIRQAEFFKWFGPLLEALRKLDGSGSPNEVCNRIIIDNQISNKMLDEVLASGGSKFKNQVAWARQYLVWEGLLEDASSGRGIWKLTSKGQSATLTTTQAREIFLKWVDVHRKARASKVSADEIMRGQEQTILSVTETLPGKEQDLLQILRNLIPKGFEQICGLLLRESGFDSVTITGRSHDGGIDGIGTLEINPFVSFKVLFQCKRYRGTVSRAEVGDFRNAVMGRAEKGIFLTTGLFSAEAVKEASREGVLRIELIDGEALIKLFERHQLGVKPKTVYEIDLKFFEPYFAS